MTIIIISLIFGITISFYMDGAFPKKLKISEPITLNALHNYYLVECSVRWLGRKFWYQKITLKAFLTKCFTITFKKVQKSVDGSNWLPDVLDAEGLVFPLTSREIVEAAKNIRWYLETVLLYETYPSRILQTTEKKQLETNCFRQIHTLKSKSTI